MNSQETISETEWLDIFGDNLVSILRDYRISQRQLADEAELSEATISHYVHKRKTPSIRAIINLSYALDCSISELIDFGSPIE